MWKRRGEALNDRLVERTLKFEGGSLMMWRCMGWEGIGYATKINGRMDADLYVGILEDELQNGLAKLLMILSSSRIMTPSTHQKRPRNGFKTTTFKLCNGQLNHQT